MTDNRFQLCASTTSEATLPPGSLAALPPGAVAVKVPPGAVPGQHLRVDHLSAAGRSFTVVIPDGVRPGQVLGVSVPPPPPGGGSSGSGGGGVRGSGRGGGGGGGRGSGRAIGIGKMESTSPEELERLYARSRSATRVEHEATRREAARREAAARKTEELRAIATVEGEVTNAPSIEEAERIVAERNDLQSGSSKRSLASPRNYFYATQTNKAKKVLAAAVAALKTRKDRLAEQQAQELQRHLQELRALEERLAGASAIAELEAIESDEHPPTRTG